MPDIFNVLKMKSLSIKTYLCCIITLFTISSRAQYEKLADSLNNLKSVDRCRVFLGYIEEYKIENELLPGFLDKFESYAQSKNDKNLLKEIDFIRVKRTIYDNYLHDYVPLINSFKKLLEKYKKEGELLFVGYCFHHIAQSQFQNGDYQLAFENNFRALEIFKKTGYLNVPNIGKFLHDLALNYYYFTDYEEVIRLMRISINLPAYNENIDIQRYNNLGMSYLKLQKNDSAKYFLHRTYQTAEKHRSNIWKGIACGNLGEIFLKENDYKKALVYFKKHYEYNINEDIESVKLSSYLNMTKVYLEMDSLERVKEFLNKAENSLYDFKVKYLGDQQRSEIIKSRYFTAKTAYLKRIGDYENALSYQDSLIKTQSVIDKKYNADQIKISADKLLIQENRLKLAEAEKTKIQQRLIYITIMCLITITAGIGYFYMYFSKLKKKRQNERLLAQKKISILEKQKIEKELESAKNEIGHFISKINKQNQILEKFETDLKKLKHLETEEKTIVDKTIDKLKNVKILTDEDWSNFQNNFEKIYPELMSALNTHTPSITTSEKRYLMLIHLNFSHKEMTRIIGVSDSAIRVTLNRVRKKLNADIEDTQQDLINKLLHEHSIL